MSEGAQCHCVRDHCPAARLRAAAPGHLRTVRTARWPGSRSAPTGPRGTAPRTGHSPPPPEGRDQSGSNLSSWWAASASRKMNSGRIPRPVPAIRAGGRDVCLEQATGHNHRTTLRGHAGRCAGYLSLITHNDQSTSDCDKGDNDVQDCEGTHRHSRIMESPRCWRARSEVRFWSRRGHGRCRTRQGSTNYACGRLVRP